MQKHHRTQQPNHTKSSRPLAFLRNAGVVVLSSHGATAVMAAAAMLACLNAGAAADTAGEGLPFVGTGAHGHSYPGATVPFGMVQLSPDTPIQGWDGCSGYHYSDSAVAGFQPYPFERNGLRLPGGLAADAHRGGGALRRVRRGGL